MGETRKKLREWAEYEFGIGVGNIPGNCLSCERAHEKLKRKPNCGKCPKAALYPENRGLFPENELAVFLYRLVQRDIRVGFEAVLIGTMDPSDAMRVIEIYKEHAPTRRSRQQTLEMMLILDRVATMKRSQSESNDRERQRQNAKHSR